MTRVGWAFLGLVILGFAAFAAMTRFGGPGAVIVTANVPRPAGGPRPALIVPVEGVARTAIVDTWGQTRGEGREHHGTDIPAPAGTPVLAAADGTVEKLFESRLGGTTLYERSSGRRWTYYYAHLAGYRAGIAEGQAVRVGQVIAYVGDTGDAGAGNYHLHFALQRVAPGQRWYEGEDVDAYPYLAGRPPAR